MLEDIVDMNKNCSKNKIEKQVMAYNIIFIIENLLRVSMHTIMEKKEGINCFNVKIFPPFKDKYDANKIINVVENAKKTKEKEKLWNINMGYEYPNFWYLEYSILLTLIQMYWDRYFKSMFINPDKIRYDVINKLRSISSVRNAVAHHRYVSNIDINMLKDTLTILNTCLDKTYLVNFNHLVLNSAEDNLNEISTNYENIIKLINVGKCIPGEKISTLITAISAFILQKNKQHLMNKVDSINKLFNDYNNLPRRPGCYNKEIEEYLNSNQVNKKLSDLMKEIRGYV